MKLSHKNSSITPIDVVNRAIPGVIKQLGQLLDEQSAFKVFIRVLPYADEPEWINLDNIPPASYVKRELHASGRSHRGAALIRLAKALRLREDRGLMRMEGPIPVLILVLGSDPEDVWQEGLSRL